MDGKKSKFEYNVFYGYGVEYFVVNRDKYTIEEAKELFVQEMEYEPKKIEEAAVRYGAGMNEDMEPCVGWWLESEADGSEPRRCPVWVMK